MRSCMVVVVVGSLLALAPAQGGAGGRYRGARKGPETVEERAVAAAIAAGFEWLAAHQDEDGKWSASLFVRHDPKGAPGDGVGKPDQDFYVTSLALLAAQADGSTLLGGRRRAMVERATGYLRSQQDSRGFLGPREPGNAVVAHAIATFALVEVAGLSGEVDVTAAGDAAAAQLRALRLVDGGWPRVVGGTAHEGEATLWSAIAMVSAKCFQGGASDCRDVPALLAADPALPRAAAVALEYFVGGAPDGAARDAVLAEKPQWPTTTQSADFLGWYLGTLACYQSGGEAWATWQQALLAASLPHQRTDGACAGSWDPVDVRGKEGGRVAATALQLHALIATYRWMQLTRR